MRCIPVSTFDTQLPTIFQHSCIQGQVCAAAAAGRAHGRTCLLTRSHLMFCPIPWRCLAALQFQRSDYLWRILQQSFFHTWLLRLRPADNYRKEAQIYRDQCVFQSAAKLWVEGVPWSDALKFSEEAERKVEPHPKGGRKGKGRGKAPGKVGKGKGRK